MPFLAGPIYALIFWSALTSWILPEAVAWRVKRATGSAEGRDKGSLTLILLLWWTGIALDFSLSLLLRQAAISWKRIPVFFVGIGLMLLGIALRWYSGRDPGEIFYVRYCDTRRSGVNCSRTVSLRSSSFLVVALSLLCSDSVWRLEIGRALPWLSPAWGPPMLIGYQWRKAPWAQPSASAIANMRGERGF